MMSQTSDITGMVSNKIKSFASGVKVNVYGRQIRKKYLVIESDDWGSIRMPNVETYGELLSMGFAVDKCPYNRFDTLASLDDLSELFSVLSKFIDHKGNTPVVTTNFNVANPDFHQMRSTDYSKYSYESFIDTLRKYYPSDDVWGLWRKGIRQGLIYPQFHGREHVNIGVWLKLLKENNKAVRAAADRNTFGLSHICSPLINEPYLAALMTRNQDDIRRVCNIINDGTKLFREIFEFNSKSFIAPMYTWNSALLPCLKDAGIEYIQGANIQKNYNLHDNSIIRTRHNFGSKSGNGLLYLNRNCSFEPSIVGRSFRLQDTLNQIGMAFYFNKPAVISAHRLNFIGSLDTANRTNNLEKLSDLLHNV